MELSEILFGEVTGVTDSAPIYEGQHERRKHPRVSFGNRAQIFPLMVGANQRGSTVMVRDMSRSGIGLLFGEELATGDEFVIRLPRKNGPAIDVQCMVARCEPGGTGGGNFVIGATFELVLEENVPEPTAASGQPALAMPPMACAIPTSFLGEEPPQPRGNPFTLTYWRSFIARAGPIRDQYKLRRRLRRGSSAHKRTWRHQSTQSDGSFTASGVTGLM